MPRRFRFPGRKPLDNRKVLPGILFVHRTGIRWEDLPQELGRGSGMTCWLRLRDWQAAEVWQRSHELQLSELQSNDRIDWSRAIVDRSSCEPWVEVRRPAQTLQIEPSPGANTI
jgi:transposase